MANASSTYLVSGLLFLSLGATKCGSSQEPEPGAGATGSATVQSSGTQTGGGASGSSTLTKKPELTTGDQGTGPEPEQGCAPPAKWFVRAGCPLASTRSFADFPSDCYLSCGQDPSVCAPGSLCRSVQYNPCLPQADGVQCDACAFSGKLCLPLLTGPHCAQFAGVYETREDRECGNTPDGVAMCKWKLTFTPEGTFSWRFSDIFQSGQYFCHDSTIYLDMSLPMGGTGPDQSYKVAFDPASKSLVWEGATYYRVP